jgi:hypothetical protein
MNCAGRTVKNWPPPDSGGLLWPCEELLARKNALMAPLVLVLLRAQSPHPAH